ncbi:hypothetical protein SCALIN_C05_0214 [Candidatus Scalindua japonica]|uniref:Uncharacterized protein n=1 Tax=Candidatus Scalindua japonica TaxID=1284222 RepID=A0A286TW65_9BACT|nr:hypothetical protein [Candidatus Scalindua japonica]GAX60129.1 hypothetical protein SCALIN_C05_0214 [Candidatus Scalindua japonica]
MPEENSNQINYPEFKIAWMNFTKSVRLLLVPQQDDRPLDQYLDFRDSVFVIVESENFLDKLQEAWRPFTDISQKEVGEALIKELKAFPRAIEVAETIEKSTTESKGHINRWLGRASIVTGSVKDLLDNVPYVKSAITLFEELISMFKR